MDEKTPRGERGYQRKREGKRRIDEGIKGEKERYRRYQGKRNGEGGLRK